MNNTTSNTRTTNDLSFDHTIVEQGRLWFRFAQILDTVLRTQGSRLWVKPTIHAQYGMRQTKALRARSFILTTRLEGGDEEILESLAQSPIPNRALNTRRTKQGGLALYNEDGDRLGRLGRPAWSWTKPLFELGYEPTFYLHKVAVHDGILKAHVVISHFHEGVEIFLTEHYRQRAEAVLA